MRWCYRFLAAAILLAGSLSCSDRSARPPVVERDIVYGKAGGVELRLDLARPTSGKGPFPVILCVHGGGWQRGDRASHHGTIRYLADHGYVGAAVQYRLAPDQKFPSQLEDLKLALRYLRSRAGELRIDPAKVGVLGDSAGGHLALLLGLMDQKNGPSELPDRGKRAARPQVVVNYYGSIDFRRWRVSPEGEASIRQSFGKGSAGLTEDFLGTSDRSDPIVSTASPAAHISPDDPPVLSFHGAKDPLVPLRGAEELHQALRKAGVRERLVTIENAGHGWAGETKARTDRIMLGFLDKHLKSDRLEAGPRQ